MNTKLKCLLLDDELPALSYIKALCEQLPDVEVVKAFNDAEKFLEASKEFDFNLCILDIQMPKLSGLEVAERLANKLIIFTTAYKEFAAEAFDMNAVDYIRKPIQKTRFEQAIAKVKTILQQQTSALKTQSIWNTDKGKTLLSFEDMLYITASDTDSRDKVVYLKNNQKVVIKNTSFDQILAVLPPRKFCRINKRDIIALKIVQHFTSDEIKTNIFVKNDQALVLPLSDVFREEFKSKLPK